jgi:CBS domain-containing protein
MTTDLETLNQESVLRDAVEMAMVRKIRHLPVLDGDSRLVGIVTDRDIKRALPSPLEGTAPDDYETFLTNTKVTQVMTREPFTVEPDTPLYQAVQLMVEKKVGGLPVVSQGRLVGIFTQTDALKVFLRSLTS